MTDKNKTVPVTNLPRGTAHPVTDLALAYFRSLRPEVLAAAADYIDDAIVSDKMHPNMGTVSETLRRINDKQSVSDRYLNSAAFYVLYNAVLVQQQAEVPDANPSS